ncbi:hypothetical protein Trydic_g14540 [Trypoxylus dichotomus]
MADEGAIVQGNDHFMDPSENLQVKRISIGQRLMDYNANHQTRSSDENATPGRVSRFASRTPRIARRPSEVTGSQEADGGVRIATTCGDPAERGAASGMAGSNIPSGGSSRGRFPIVSLPFLSPHRVLPPPLRVHCQRRTLGRGRRVGGVGGKG